MYTISNPNFSTLELALAYSSFSNKLNYRTFHIVKILKKTCTFVIPTDMRSEKYSTVHTRAGSSMVFPARAEPALFIN